MDRIRRLPLPALLPIVFVVVGALYFLLGLFSNPSGMHVVARLIGALFYAVAMTAFFGIAIAIRRRRAGGADAVNAMRHTIRTGELPADADTAAWTSELERYRVRYRRNRWSVPVMFVLFAALSVYLAASVSPFWWLFLLFFVGSCAYAMWDTRRALRNLDTAIAELQRRPVGTGAATGAAVPAPTVGASWTLPESVDRDRDS
ncbi:hypothetical protein [Curtobacterium pusillum]|uniref:hypothetical protein n=1 Tax=Curtobacterium pusillum TaxID=69373 RepID=UPI00119CD276|nr:hypothetical protein [Curtobacterium pusillum]